MSVVSAEEQAAFNVQTAIYSRKATEVLRDSFDRKKDCCCLKLSGTQIRELGVSFE